MKCLIGSVENEETAFVVPDEGIQNNLPFNNSNSEMVITDESTNTSNNNGIPGKSLLDLYFNIYFSLFYLNIY